MSRTLDDILTRLGIPQDALARARQRQSTEGGSLRENLIALNLLTEEAFAKRVTEQLRVPYTNPRPLRIAHDVLALLPKDKAEKYVALPLELDSRHRRLSILMADPADMSTLDELKFIIGYTLIPHYAPEDELSDVIRTEYARFEEAQALAAMRPMQAQQSSGIPELRMHHIDVAGLAEKEPVLNQLIGAIFTVAHARHATEFSLTPTLEDLRLSGRIDGKQMEIARFPFNLSAPLVNRIRRLFGVEMVERTSPITKGCVTFRWPDKEDVVASFAIAPTIHGDSLLIKLREQETVLTIEDFALDPEMVNSLQTLLTAPRGFVFVTGTEKSGMSTTLYAFLARLRQPHLNILTIEDPIETTLDGMMQGQIAEDADHSSTQYLHYALRQSPHIVLLPQFYEFQEFHHLAALAARSLVLSSFAALDTASAVMKLLVLTSPEFVVQYVNGITSQRLVRKICTNCKEEIGLPEAHREKLGLSVYDRCYAGKGCDDCGQTGYQGMTPIFEVLPLTDPIQQALLKGCTVHELRALSAEHHMLSMRDDGMRKVKQGITTLQEVLRATML